MPPKQEDPPHRFCSAWTIFKMRFKTIWLKLKTPLAAKAVRVRPTHSHNSNKLSMDSSWDADSWHFPPILVRSYLELTETRVILVSSKSICYSKNLLRAGYGVQYVIQLFHLIFFCSVLRCCEWNLKSPACQARTLPLTTTPGFI